MAYDETLAARVRALLISRDGYDEKKMFGGICFMLHGRMACGIVRDRLIVRVGRQAYGEALARPHAEFFDLTGRPLTGWVQVAPEGWTKDEDLTAWVERGVVYAMSLPPRETGVRQRKARKTRDPVR
jgi:TfoX/Sxy family transcriptional regulator of competence genes